MNKQGQEPQQQKKPGTESKMHPKPQTDNPAYKAAGKFEGKTVLITGADSGIGKATAIAFAKEGANVVIVYLSQDQDAEKTKNKIMEKGQRYLLIKGDVGNKKFCENAIKRTIEEFGSLDVLINNAGEQHPQKNLEDISEEQLIKTFRTNIFAMFYMSQAALPYLKEGSSIINTASVTAYKGQPILLDYSSTKGAIVSFTRSLALNLASKGIRVNAVAPGPIWTPLIPSTFPLEKIESFGTDVPMGRAGEPSEVAPCFIFLASSDATYLTGQILHPNGGIIVNG